MKIICIGRNYADHTQELKNEIPSEPVFFMKPDTALLRNNDPFYLPDFSNEIHYEVELLIRINKVGKHIDREFAHRYYDEIGLGIDFTARDVQSELKKKGLPWEKAKAFDYSAPISSVFLKKDKLNLKNIDFQLNINEKMVQKGNSKKMIFDFDEIISYISKYLTLKIGDIIFTGTPAGVGKIKIEDKLQAYINDNCMLNFLIK